LAAALSVPPAALPAVNSDDVVQPGDAILQALLDGTAEHTHDTRKRDGILDLIVTLPPLEQWPTASLERLRSLARAAVDPRRGFWESGSASPH
jgi:hypothetical protein